LVLGLLNTANNDDLGNLGLTTGKAIVAGISISQRECYEIF